MKEKNSDLQRMARASLKGNWTIAIAVFLVQLLISGSLVDGPISWLIGGPISWLIGGPLSLGLAIFSLKLSRGEEHEFADLFAGFRNFGLALASYLLTVLYVVLWTLLLIVPGILATLSYSMTFYIIADDKTIRAREAIQQSKELIYGYRWQLFCLFLRFLAWSLLAILSLGIGFIWLIPYMGITYAKFYDGLKAAQLEQDSEQDSGA